MLEKKKMSVNGMIDRAKIAQRYITDEFVQSYKIYDSSMKNIYIDKATLAGKLEEGKMCIRDSSGQKRQRQQV